LAIRVGAAAARGERYAGEAWITRQPGDADEVLSRSWKRDRLG
jgi:hypothetical protein